MLRVGIIGRGAIGKAVAGAVQRQELPSCVLSGVVTRGSRTSITDLLNESDIVVEAAGHEALAEHGPHVVASGVDLLVVSVGALVDDGLMRRLRPSDGGRVLVSSGAIGGLDLLRAAAIMGPLYQVSLESRKRPDILIQPWMDSAVADRLAAGRDVVEAFTGSAREAARRFPQSANVAATLGLATIGLDATRVSIIGDPDAAAMRHTIRAAGAAGTYEIVVENTPSADNPRTSALVAYAVVRALRDLASNTLIGV